MNATEQELQETIKQVLQQAVTQHQAGQIQNAKDLYLAILEIQPEHPDANYNLGVLLVEIQDAEAGLQYIQTAVTSKPKCEQFWLSYIETLILTEQLTAAQKALALGLQHGLNSSAAAELEMRITIQQQASQTTIEKQPEAIPQEKDTSPVKAPQSRTAKGPSRQDIKKLKNLHNKGRLNAIEKFSRDLTVRFPNHGLGWKTLGDVLIKREMIDEALRCLNNAVQLLPEDLGVRNNLGVCQNKKIQYDKAEYQFKKALELDPDFTPALCNLGNLLRILGRYTESEQHFRHAIKKEPSEILYNNLGTTLLDAGKIIEAETCYRHALKLNPKFTLAQTNLAVCLRKQGQLTEAIEYLRKAVKLDPQNTEQRSNLLFTLNYSANTASFFLKEALQFGKLVSQKAQNPFSVWQCDANPERLRVGILSGDFHNHPVGYFLENILSDLHSRDIELIGYPTNPKTDDLTTRIKQNFDEWKPLYNSNDEQAANLIHADKIHVLIDLSGHTSHNRLPMLALKPAPIQVNWLGYFATTGVAEIDYFLADKVGVSEAHKKNFTETIWYLPDTRLCFSAPNHDIPITPLPALENKHITFGCFQLLTKVGDEVLEIWSKILNTLPDTKLRWQCPQFDDPVVVEKITERLQRIGIDSNRVTFHGKMPRARYLAAHSKVDFILDTFPFPGGTTTCEALWMGVPTLTLSGSSLLSRQGASMLTAAGLGEWVAFSKEEYIEKANAFAENLEKLAALRTQLREQVLNSPLFDAPLFAKNFKAALWGMWEEKKPQNQLLGQVTASNKPTENTSEEKPVMTFFNPVFWGTKDPERFTNLMKEASQLTTAFHFGDNMFLFQRNNSMLNDKPFMESWEKNAISPPDRTIIWRRYILTMAGFHCQHLEGDFVECGAYQGVGAKTVIDYLGGKDFSKTFWLYDLFEHKKDSVNHSMQAHGPQLHQQVVNRFADYPNVKIFKGFLPDVLKEGCPEKIAYLHLDLNQAPAEIATLDALFDRVVPGGMIILDDYEMVFYRAQKLAEDTWFGKRGYKVFPLPTSQGFVIKR